ncbi:hypothetical protein ACH4C6_09375 [Streptomyces sp. NPDC017943]|uniref:hypothetical protein n=1 Tax=Streptomyces sp. NPDC017943 TaxID=3365019 RepID=UPI0037A77A72
MLCGLIGLPPAGFTGAVAPASAPGSHDPVGRVDTYLSAFQAELDPRSVRPYAAMVVQHLLTGVFAVDPDTGRGPGPAARHLSMRVLDGPGSYADLVADTVERLATEVPYWKETEADRAWLERIAERLPRLRSALALREVHRVALHLSGTPQDCETFAAHACSARRTGAANEGIRAALEAWALRGRPGERVRSFLEAYRRQWARYAGDGRALEECEDLERALALNGRNSPVLRHYCDHAIRELTTSKAEALREIQRLQEEQRRYDEEIGRLHALDRSAGRIRG